MPQRQLPIKVIYIHKWSFQISSGRVNYMTVHYAEPYRGWVIAEMNFEYYWLIVLPGLLICSLSFIDCSITCINKRMCHTSADYVEDIYQAFLVAEDRDQLGDAIHDMNPPPMNTMLEKQSREEAIEKRTKRRGKTVQDVPPTTPGNWHFKMSKCLEWFNPTISKSCEANYTTLIYFSYSDCDPAAATDL